MEYFSVSFWWFYISVVVHVDWTVLAFGLESFCLFCIQCQLKCWKHTDTKSQYNTSHNSIQSLKSRIFKYFKFRVKNYNHEGIVSNPQPSLIRHQNCGFGLRLYRWKHWAASFHLHTYNTTVACTPSCLMVDEDFCGIQVATEWRWPLTSLKCEVKNTWRHTTILPS